MHTKERAIKESYNNLKTITRKIFDGMYIWSMYKNQLKSHMVPTFNALADHY